MVGLLTEWSRGNTVERRAEGMDLGGTMRLGAYPAALAADSLIAGVYGATEISERHRHRYEVNINYRAQLEATGLRFETPGDTVPHPRSYGTFPRKIGRYAIADGVVPLEFAIRSATGLPADILKLPHRGYLKAGDFADVVVFDPKTFRDTATFDKPHQYATGIEWVFVNGQPEVAKGVYEAKVLGGKAIRHEEK